MNKRERLEIIHDILRIIKENDNLIKPTPLLRKSNLSSQGFNEYINNLIMNELIKEIIDKKGNKIISLTDNGFRYLERYQTIKNFISEFGL